jgi:hypothetical protein
MRILLVILISIFFIPIVFSQEPDFKRYDITPANVNEIGGLNTYKNSHYMLISTSVFYSGRMRESSEARSIRQKYDEWEIHYFVPDTVKDNMNSMWTVKNASPNGFSILDDNTVVYIDKQTMIRTNDPVMDKQLKGCLIRNSGILIRLCLVILKRFISHLICPGDLVVLIYGILKKRDICGLSLAMQEKV